MGEEMGVDSPVHAELFISVQFLTPCRAAWRPQREAEQAELSLFNASPD